jgi:hypothetical protein
MGSVQGRETEEEEEEEERELDQGWGVARQVEEQQPLPRRIPLAPGMYLLEINHRLRSCTHGSVSHFLSIAYTH